ncbi:MAG TPA: hypothetical protein VHM70_30025 [Polyangiaceae bacterium]|nr:hypothetical protein [Polyangiaceae bacterium]
MVVDLGQNGCLSQGVDFHAKRSLLRVGLLVAFACNREGGAPLGGQAGDDGDVAPKPSGPPAIDTPPPEVPTPPSEPPAGGPPPIDNCDGVYETVASGARTVFGATAEGLIANLELQATPFYWVGYDVLSRTKYLPGVSETSLELTLSVAPQAEVKQEVRSSTQHYPCAANSVDVPVNVSFKTRDGALDERFSADLHFTTPFNAEFYFELQLGEIDGSFRFTQIGSEDSSRVYAAQSLYADVALWPGGSRGEIVPDIAWTNPPPNATPPAPTLAPWGPVEPSNAVAIGEHWSSLAVWPSNLQCATGGMPTSRDARVNSGLSAEQIREAVNALNSWDLTSDGQSARVEFTVDPLPEYLCNGFQGMARLRALSEVGVPIADGGSGADAGLDARSPATLTSKFAGLDASGSFTIRSIVDPEAGFIRSLAFSRLVEDTVLPLSRQELTANTGLMVDAADEYQRFWWSWQARAERQHADADFQTRAELLVTSLNAAQSAASDQQVAQGGPGASIGIGNDGWLQLPGDVILRAARNELPPELVDGGSP